jgi:negative regulator of flagellin synthesis FlgM
MKQVDLNAISSAQTRQTQRTNTVGPSGTGSTANASSAAKTIRDQVNVSSTAKEVGQLVERAKNLPSIRQERVDELRALIESGQYDVSSQTIAAAILRDEQ